MAMLTIYIFKINGVTTITALKQLHIYCLLTGNIQIQKSRAKIVFDPAAIPALNVQYSFQFNLGTNIRFIPIKYDLIFPLC